MKRFLRWLLDWCVIVPLVSVLLLELVLQLGALMLDKRSPDAQAWLDGGVTTRIVMMGDSNTYGIYLDQSESYPSRFLQKWNVAHAEQPIEVINLGFPGMNSSRVLGNLPEVLDTFKPDMVTVMIGVNDFWTAPIDVEGVESGFSSLEKFFRDHSRVYKLVYMLQRELYNPSKLRVDQQARQLDFSNEQNAEFVELLKGEKAVSAAMDMPSAVSYGDIDFSIGYVFEPQRQSPAKSLNANLSRMVDLCRDYGVELVFLTYPYFDSVQKVSNRQMKLVAKNRGVPLLNVAAAFRQLCAGSDERCSDYFFPDYHPLASGYDAVADVLVAETLPLLAADAVKVTGEPEAEEDEAH